MYMLFRISEHSACCPPTVLLPGAALPSFIGQDPFGLGSPVSGTMTALRLLIVRPGRLLLSLPVLSVCSSFVSPFFSASVPSEREDSPVYLYPALSVGGPTPPETMSPHTFPYDPSYICPALRPRPRRPHSRIVRPRPLPRPQR